MVCVQVMFIQTLSFESFKSILSCLSRAYELAVFSLLAEEHVAFMAAATNRATGYPRILTSLHPAILELSSERSEANADWFAVCYAMDAILQTVLRKPVIFEQAKHEIKVVFELMGYV
ncbi:MAG TPA: hypothetical protein VGO47_01580 [Chlamydiales bacterium]|nr:hypothetical protein [Chlamydiales bacterium]